MFKSFKFELVSFLFSFKTEIISESAESSSVCLGGSCNSTDLKTSCPAVLNIIDEIMSKFN